MNPVTRSPDTHAADTSDTALSTVRRWFAAAAWGAACWCLWWGTPVLIDRFRDPVIENTLHLALASALAIAAAAWMFYAPLSLPQRIAWGLAGQAALLWHTYVGLDALGDLHSVSLPLGFILTWLGTTHVAALLGLAIAQAVGLPFLPPPEGNETEPARWQLSLLDLFLLTIPIAIVLTIASRATLVPHRDWHHDFFSIATAFLVLLYFGNLWPLLIVGGAALWSAPRGVAANAVCLALSAITAAINAWLLLKGVDIPYSRELEHCVFIALGAVILFAFLWCFCRLLLALREAASPQPAGGNKPSS